MGFVTLLSLSLFFVSVVVRLWPPDRGRQALEITFDAIVNWLDYPIVRPTPGTYSSAYPLRQLRVTAVFALLVYALLPFADFLPLHLAFYSETPWERTHSEWPSVRRELSKASGTLGAQRRAEHATVNDSLAVARQPGALRAEMLTAFRKTPDAWVYAAFRGVFRGEFIFAWPLLVGMVLSLVVPVLLFLSIIFLVIGRPLASIREEMRADENTDGTEFDHYIHRIARSAYVSDDGIRERDHLLIGCDSRAGRPILLAKDLLNGHAHILGSTQSGKTSLALSPMLAQMIRGLDPGSTEYRQQSSILILDLKGDPALFQNVRHECQCKGVRFKFFTTGYHDASHAFNPFEQAHLADVSPEQRVDMLARAMGIFYGHDYPEVYWSDKNAQVFRTLLAHYPDIRSFARFYHYAKDARYYRAAGGYLDDWKKASHLAAAAQKLADIVSLNVTKDESPSLIAYRERIDMRPLASNAHEPQVVYFYIRATDQEATGHAIAKLALYSLLTAINTLPEHEKKRTYVFIDEFQVIAQDVLARLFEQAAGLRVSYVLSNQSLMTLTETIREVLAENTAFRQVFRAGSLNMRRYLQDRSGETIYHLYAFHTHGSSGGSTETQFVGPNYRDADIISTSYDDLESWVEMSAPRGFSRYGGDLFTIRAQYHITRAEYERRSKLPWPAKSTGTFVAAEQEHILNSYRTTRLTTQSKDELVRGVEQRLAALPVSLSADEPLLPDKPIQPYPEFDELVERYEQSYKDMIMRITQG